MEQILLKVPEVQEALGLGRSSIYELMALGELPRIYIGRSVRVPARAVREYAERLESEQAQG